MIDREPQNAEGEPAEDRPSSDDQNQAYGKPEPASAETPRDEEKSQSQRAIKRDLLDLSDQGREGGSKARNAGDDRPDSQERGDGRHEPGSQSGKQDDNPPKPPPKKVFVIAGLILLALVAWGGYQHWQSYNASQQVTDDTVNRPIEVRTTEAKRLDKPLDLTLPGETQAFDTANIYARATGYITERRVDIGTRVKKGDLLIRIASPDLDQQLNQAEAQIGQTQAALTQATAQVAQAEANVNLAKVNYARSDQLTQQGYETQQNRDQRQADLQSQQANLQSAQAGVRVAQANIAAQQANINRLKALTAFESVEAPFDGIVTARNVDLGELVNADSSTGSPMFTIVRDSIIRVTVRVPQSSAEGIQEGLPAKIVVAQTPGRTFDGRVMRSSVALLYSSRTLTTEVDVPNETGELRPGLYVTVSFAIPRTKTDVSVPAEALMFDQHGMRVASLDGDIVKMNQVNIYRDHGSTVDLRDGLKGGERIILNPAATLKDGGKVKEIREEDEKKKDEEDKAKTASADKNNPEKKAD